tara:strand:- start:7394 stop:7729 length:336 start_codon:yes stop_codon:yes gene_type:complete
MLYGKPSLIVVSKRADALPIPSGYTQILIDRETPFGNRCFGVDRADSIKQHREFVENQIKLKTQFYKRLKKLAKRIHKGEKIALVCWCSPKPCHGDNLKQAILKIKRLKYD